MPVEVGGRPRGFGSPSWALALPGAYRASRTLDLPTPSYCAPAVPCRGPASADIQCSGPGRPSRRIQPCPCGRGCRLPRCLRPGQRRARIRARARAGSGAARGDWAAGVTSARQAAL